MNKRTYNYLFLCLMLIISICTVDVKAAVFHAGKENLNGSSYGISGGGSTAYIKKVDNSIAYCPEFSKIGPKEGQNLTPFGSIYSRENYIAGQIIRIGRDKFTGKKQYMYISQTLNCFYKYPKSNTTGCSNNDVKSMLNQAINNVNKYKFNSNSSKASLPKVIIKASSVSMNRTSTSTNKNAVYVSAPITVSGLDNTNYGSVGTNKYTSSTKPKYTVSLSNNKGGSVKLCIDAAGTNGCLSNGGEITNNGTYYLIVSNGGIDGGSATVKINGSNTSKYPSAKRWNGGDVQRLITYTDSATVTRSVSATGNFKYAPAEKYSVSITKLDDSGEILPGASLKLFTSADAEGKTDNVTLCTTNPEDKNGACTKTGIVEGDNYKYSTGRFICYSETTTPNGYTSISTHCDPITLGNTTYYYKTESNGDGESVITKEEYDKSQLYTQGDDLKYQFHVGAGTSSADYIYNLASTMYKYEYSDGRAVEYKTTDEEYKHSNSVDDGQGGTTVVNEWYIEDGTNPRVNITVTPIEGKSVCHNDTAGVSENLDYCSGDYQYNSALFSSGNAIINVGNALNYVNISKKAITGDDEVPGATLSIYKADKNGKCSDELAKAKRFVYSPFEAPESTDSSSNTSSDESSSSNDSDDGEELVDQDTTEGNDEGLDIAASGLRWISSNTSATVYGLDTGNYCLREELPPAGYKVSPTTVKFTMNESGEITNVEKDYYDEESKTLIVNDEYTRFSVSKADITTTKELPGAELKICAAAKNENGKYELISTETGDVKDCVPDLLADGTEASWTSGNEPHDIIGLAAGTYYLIETTAPNGYVKAESILFTLKEDGTLTDVNGKPLANNKLVMYDDFAHVPYTLANIPFVILMFGIVFTLISLGGYFWLYKNNAKEAN